MGGGGGWARKVLGTKLGGLILAAYRLFLLFSIFTLGLRGMTCKLDIMKSLLFLIRRWPTKQSKHTFIVIVFKLAYFFVSLLHSFCVFLFVCSSFFRSLFDALFFPVFSSPFFHFFLSFLSIRTL